MGAPERPRTGKGEPPDATWEEKAGRLREVRQRISSHTASRALVLGGTGGLRTVLAIEEGVLTSAELAPGALEAGRGPWNTGLRGCV